MAVSASQAAFEEAHDAVNRPKHYCRPDGMECFEEFELLYGEVAAFYACLFNVHKYRYRAADKNGEEDLRKSDWYMRKLKEIKETYGISIPPIDTNVDYYD